VFDDGGPALQLDRIPPAAAASADRGRSAVVPVPIRVPVLIREPVLIGGDGVGCARLSRAARSPGGVVGAADAAEPGSHAPAAASARARAPRAGRTRSPGRPAPDPQGSKRGARADASRWRDSVAAGQFAERDIVAHGVAQVADGRGRRLRRSAGPGPRLWRTDPKHTMPMLVIIGSSGVGAEQFVRLLRDLHVAEQVRRFDDPVHGRQPAAGAVQLGQAAVAQPGQGAARLAAASGGPQAATASAERYAWLAEP